MRNRPSTRATAGKVLGGGFATAAPSLPTCRIVLGLLLSVAVCHIPFVRAQGASASPVPQPSDRQRLAAEAGRALAAGQYLVAEQDYRNLLKLGVDSAAVFSNLGVVYMRTGRLDQAIRMFSEAKRLAPGTAGVSLNIGLAYFREHQFKKAASQFADTLALDPDNIQARYLKGECHFMLDEFSQAVTAFEPLLSMEQGDLDYLFMLGTSYGMLKRTEESLRTFALMVKSGEDTPHLHLLLGKSYLALGQNDRAAAELNRAATQGSVPFAHYYLGVLNRQLGQLESAQAEFEQETQIDPTNALAFNELAELRLDQADPRSAISVLEKGLSHNHDAPELHATLGRAYLQVENGKRAIEALQQAIALSPSTSSYHYQLARAYLNVGHTARAHAELERARALGNDAPPGRMQSFARDQESRSGTNASR